LCKKPLLAVILTTALCAAVAAADFPKPTGPVNDFAGLLDASTTATLSTLIDAVEKDTTAEIAVATVSTLDGMSVEEYANKLFKEWGIGQKRRDNGVLVLVAPNQQTMRIEVGYGLEGVLPDGRAGNIMREEFVPRFQANDYQGGIVRGVERIAAILRKDASNAESREFAPSPPGLADSFIRWLVLTAPVIVFALVAAFMLTRRWRTLQNANARRKS
jgi:uncharacterized protein